MHEEEVVWTLEEVLEADYMRMIYGDEVLDDLHVRAPLLAVKLLPIYYSHHVLVILTTIRSILKSYQPSLLGNIMGE